MRHGASRRSFLWDVRRRTPLASNPGAERATPSLPYSELLQVGFSERVCRQTAGALLPHLFTLAGPEGLGRCVFCATFRRVAPPSRYEAPCPVEIGLSSAFRRTSRPSSLLTHSGIIA